MSTARPSAAARVGRPDVVLVSHGFQTNYERGFSNGVATLPVRATLIGSDRTDAAGLNPALTLRNLRGSQEEGRSRLGKLLNLARYLCSLVVHVARRPASTVHVIGLIEPPLVYGIALGGLFRLLARRYVLTVHNLLPHERHTAAQRRWFRLAFQMPHCLVVHTATMADRLVHDFDIPRERIVHMEHGIEPTPREAVGSPAEAPSSVPNLLFFGVLKHYKGLDLLLEALASFQGAFRLDIHGICTSDALARDIESRIAAHPSRGSIHWHRGFVPEDRVPQVFESADVLVLPYRAIDQSGVLFQALRHGLPIVASRVGSFQQYIDAELGELCRPDDATDLRGALERWASRRQGFDRQRIRERARAFEWPVTVKVLESVYAP